MGGLNFRGNHKFFETFEKKTQQLFAAGIIDHYAADYNDNLNPKQYEHLYRDGPQILTLAHLEAGFVIWIVSICIAISVFICEWLVTLKDFLVIQFVLMAFYKHKRGTSDRLDVNNTRVEESLRKDVQAGATEKEVFVEIASENLNV